jgi:ADP-heptose:LPS heptosyltransferase
VTGKRTAAHGAAPNILVVRRHNQVGDTLCSQPLFAALKRRWPDAHITLLAAPTNYPIPFRDLVPQLDDTWTYEASTLGSLRRLLPLFRARRFHIAVVPSTIRLSFSCHLYAAFSRARLRAGVRAIDGKTNPAHVLLNAKASFDWTRRHQVLRHLDIARLLGCTAEGAEAELVQMRLSADDHAAAAAFVASLDLQPGTKLLGLHPGGGQASRRWNPSNFVAAARRIHSVSPLQVVLTCGAIDEESVAATEAGLQEAGIPFTREPQLPLRHLAAVLQRFDAYVCNDTGTMHIAAAVGANLVALFVPGASGIWGPRTGPGINLESPSSSINEIDPADVAAAALRLMQGRG